MGLEAWRSLAIMLLVTFAGVFGSIIFCWQPAASTPHRWPVVRPVVSCAGVKDAELTLCLARQSNDIADEANSLTVQNMVVSANGVRVSAAAALLAFAAWVVSAVALHYGRKSSDAAAQAAENSSLTFREERARLLCRQVQFAVSALANSELSIVSAETDIHVVWQNFGKRAAVGVVATIGMSSKKKGELPDIDEAPPPPMSDWTSVGPGDTFTTPAWISGPTRSIDGYLNPDRDLYFYSAIAFADVLDRTKIYREHVLFRVKIEPPKQPGRQDLKVYLDDVIIRDGHVVGVWHELPNNGRG